MFDFAKNTQNYQETINMAVKRICDLCVYLFLYMFMQQPYEIFLQGELLQFFCLFTTPAYLYINIIVLNRYLSMIHFPILSISLSFSSSSFFLYFIFPCEKILLLRLSVCVYLEPLVLTGKISQIFIRNNSTYLQSSKAQNKFTSFYAIYGIPIYILLGSKHRLVVVLRLLPEALGCLFSLKGNK